MKDLEIEFWVELVRVYRSIIKGDESGDLGGERMRFKVVSGAGDFPGDFSVDLNGDNVLPLVVVMEI